MPLEFLRQQTQVNIKNLILEPAPKRECVFDPDKEITPADKASIAVYISRDNDFDGIMEVLPWVMILDPSTKSDMADILDPYMAAVEQEHERSLGDRAFARLVDPDSYPYNCLDQSDPVFTNPQKRIITNFDDLMGAYHQRLVYSNIPPDHFKASAIRKYLRGESKALSMVLQLADHARARIVNPLVTNEMNPFLWRASLDLLDLFRTQGNWREFVNLASDLKVVGAASVEITQQGLIIESNKKSPFTTAKPPMPEARRF